MNKLIFLFIYITLVPVLINALKEQDVMMKEQQRILSEQQSELDELKSMMKKIIEKHQILSLVYAERVLKIINKLR